MDTHAIRLQTGLLLTLFLLLTATVGAQVLSGTLTGSVVDPTNARIPGAAVTVVDLDTGRQYGTISDDFGEFTLTNLPNGFYKVTIELSGFSKFTADRVQVNVAQTSRIAARLEVAGVGIDVAVSAEQMVVQTESMELKNAVDRRQIMELPLPTRNPLDLVRTMAGIVTPTGSGIADSFVHGLRGNSTNITHDGINVADNFVKTSSFFALSAPTVDAVGEFSVSVGGVGVDAGFGAAQVSIRTPRGSNDIHGSAYWFQRTNALNANTWFNNARGVARPFQLQNRIGFNAGGPVYVPGIYDGRNRSFFFWNYEAFREPVSRPRTRTVLTSTARQGQFTYARTDNGQRETVNLLPLGTIGATGRTPTVNAGVMDFYNSIVPSDGLTDVACGNGDGINIRCFSFNLPGKNVTDRYTLRADHEFSDKHSVEFVFNKADFDSSPDLLNAIEPLFPKSKGGGQGSQREVFVWAFHSIFGGNKTNEARAGFTRAPVGFNLYNDFKETGGFQVDLPARVTDPTLVSTNLPQGRNTPVLQLSDNFAWVKNRHQFRFGGEYKQITADSYFYNVVVPKANIGSNAANPNGITATDFAGGISAGDLARASDLFNIVTGLHGTIQQGFNHTSPKSGFVPGVPRTIDPIQNNFSFYFQDSFKPQSNFNLQFGARWEYQGVFDLRNRLILRPKDGEAGLFGPAGVNNFFSPRATPAMTDTLLDFSGGRNGQLIHDRDLNNFSPFLGFAWDPRGDGKTAVRGAFSMHYTQDGFTLFQTSATLNTGLFTVATNSVPTGTFSTSSNPTPAAPVASFPISQRQNFNSVSNASDLWFFNPNLRTPYVQEWNLSVQRELWNRLTIEARYVGNHAVKLFRSWNINELNIENNGLVDEFRNAQRNLAIAGNNFSNQGRAGQAPVPIFDRLFASLPAASGFANSQFITWLNQNQIGNMFDNIRRTPTFQANREANFPLNFFVQNPFADEAIMVDNSSWSIYHGGELEVARRFSSGLFFQGNYTLGKVLTDTRFLTSQQEFQRFRRISDRSLDKNRAAFDVRHSFSSNFVYPLPFGAGKWLGTNAGPIVNKLIGGWNVQGLTRWSSGSPFSIISNRRTTGSLDLGANADIPASLRNMSAADLQKKIGVFRTPTGVFWLDPNSGTLKSASSFSTPSTTRTSAPLPEQDGTRPTLSTAPTSAS
ncbi:MAG: carboxypeptidase regulatory-like domain-containing protein [Acidobacteria bacterium]|nr:carboxypeptidase regulatory-like domain-containing protein [Acidobacteriota bacterium]